MCTQSQLKIILSAVRKEAENIFGDKLVEVVLFGSYARGDYDDESDIDIMVRAKIERAELYKYGRLFTPTTSKLGLDNDIVVSVHVTDDSTFTQYREAMPFYRNIINEGVQINA